MMDMKNDTPAWRAARLRNEVIRLATEITRLRSQIKRLEKELAATKAACPKRGPKIPIDPELNQK
jgi:predicted  nucleic acid-binding Zn-ribbon protein